MELTARSVTAGAPVAPAFRGAVSRAALCGRLTSAGRVTAVSAPPGSGKTLLLRSWIAESGLAKHAAWVPVQGESDPQRFWIMVADALRDTAPAAALVRPLTAAPDLDGWAIVERLLKDLSVLDDRVWLVVDDAHELRSAEVLRQLELLLMRAPERLRFVLATRHDLRLGLHRLRLQGELTEIRAADLRFTPEEARALFEAAGVQLPDAALTLLHARAEGWAAGLRLAALSLAGHPDPARFVEEFSGTERTVAEYLLAEVLERQPAEVRQLLLRTSLLERVSGELADQLTGGHGGERILQELEGANAFVMSLDARRSWFRYHQMFADLLQLELRRTVPGELPALHSSAAAWFAGHGYPVEAIRHAQAAENWNLAARLLADNWFSLDPTGQAATAHELLTAFPAAAVTADPELHALLAADELNRGSLQEAERRLALATGTPELVPADRRRQFQALLVSVRLLVARQRSNLPAVVEETQRLLALAEDLNEAQPGFGKDLRALALISLGIAELWTDRLDEAERHLEQGVALAHEIGRPFLEFSGLVHRGPVAGFRSIPLAVERSMQAIDLARRHGWTEEPVAAVAYADLGRSMAWQGRLGEAEGWLERAERALRTKAQPAAHLLVHYARGLLELARGRNETALSAFQAAQWPQEALVIPHTLAMRTRARVLQTHVRLGQAECVEQALAEFDEHERETGEMRIILAALRLSQGDPQAATVALAPALQDIGSAKNFRTWMVEGFLLEAIARDELGDAGAVRRALESALDLAEPDGVLLPFLLHPAAELLKEHSRHRTPHAWLISQILDLLAQGGAGVSSPGQDGNSGEGLGRIAPAQATLREPLSQSETRVLRYLPTNLTAPEIADQLYLSVNTIQTHMRHIYAKLGAHRRGEAVERARAAGLLGPSTRRR